ncbi:MAG: 3-phosphoshikimate 1-carboxyvinyltransferase [Candidatus Heimdallarchaeota archaeon]
MNVKIIPSNGLKGEIIAPGSKSYSHRAFIAASLAEGISTINNPLTSGDVKVTMDMLETLGINIIRKSSNIYIVQNSKGFLENISQILDCKNSGTSIRIFSALSLLIKGGLSFRGEFLIKSRPILPLLEALTQLGVKYNLSTNLLHIKRAKKICQDIKIRGDISSQFITALLMICPLLKCETKDYINIEITSPITSYPFIDITLEILSSFGIDIQEQLDENKLGTYKIQLNQKYRAQTFEIPGDFSSIAFIIAGAIISPENSKVIIKNLDFKKPQGDKKIIKILQQMGARIEVDIDQNRIIVSGNLNQYPLKGINIDCRDIPDLFPILSIIAAFADDKTILYNASTLRLKESDRISVVARELKKMGVKVIEGKDKLTIFHCKKLRGSVIDHNNDHRIALAFSIGALYANSNSQINNVDVVEDSFPDFIRILRSLGAKIQEINK